MFSLTGDELLHIADIS
ncbi:MAG TPA: hypothetical protein PK867_15660, partial [Pirellulales bacterium]|nr:hypothetical protein [Pirellulales bacterium]